MITIRPFGRRCATAAALSASVFCAGAALPGIAHAALGGSPMNTPAGASVVDLGPGPARTAHAASQGASPTASASQPQAQSTAASWTVRQTTLATGTTVREYLSADGTVFGVAWNGPRLPNLSELLGSYFPQYVSTVSANRSAGLRGPGAVSQPGLVVHSGGHMGAFSGEAWLPQALPAGVTPSDIQ